MKIARRWTPALAGAAAALGGLGAAELIAGLFTPTASPLSSVGAAAIDLAPGWAKDVMIGLFGTGDKLALLVLLVLVVGGLSALAGVVQARRPPWGMVMVIAVGLIAVVAAITRPDSGLLSSAPSVIGVLVAGMLLRRFTASAALTPPPDRRLGTPTPEQLAALDDPAGRRAFLRTAGLVSAVGVVAVAGGQWIGASARRARQAIASVALPNPTTTAAPVPADASFDIPGLSPLITPNDDFYRIDTALVVPELDPAEWTLLITGMVDQEVTIDYAELLALPLQESHTTLLCVSNEVGGDLISTATWLGYPLRLLLERAGVSPDADMVLSRSSDGFTAGTPIEAMTDDRNAIIAVAMNGEPLPAEHGFPARLVVPGLYGYVSATKWVVELQVTRFDLASAYWTDRGWGERGPIKISSRVDVARVDQAKENVTVAGVAWAPHDGIDRVEVQIDGGRWADATLAGELDIDTWRQWRFDSPIDGGSHTVAVRATSRMGVVQTSTEQGVLPDGATGLDSLTFTV